MAGPRLNIIVLSSSRADYSIYLPLITKLKKDTFFNLKIIAFGTHCSGFYGNTYENFLQESFEVIYKLESLVLGDSPEAISSAMGLTTLKFSSIWAKEKENIDLVFCLGDRYEMFAAVSSAIPFNIPIAHIHGGETTLGAIDNVFRHSITLASKFHFVSTVKAAKRVENLIGDKENIFPVGALSIDNIKNLKLLSKEEFKKKFNIVLDSPVLVTFHPETVALDSNKKYINEIIEALKLVKKQIIITMPNADTDGNIIRSQIIDFGKNYSNVYTVESLGTTGYYSAIKHCSFVLGNSSSGIIEVASFGKYVINLGTRQKGREVGENIIDCEVKKTKIIQAINSIDSLPKLNKINIYGDGTASDKMIKILNDKFRK